MTMPSPTRAELDAELAKLRAALKRERAKAARLGGALTESREHQAATAEVLRAISQAQTDAQPVFEVIADSTIRLFKAWSVSVFRYEGGLIRLAATRGGLPGSDRSFTEHLGEPRPPSEDRPEGRAVLSRLVQHVVDASSDPGWSAGFRTDSRLRGFGSLLVVPMLRGEHVLGVIGVSREQRGGFTPAEIALLQTFADQAVIAVENARVLAELQTKNANLTEALKQQTATSELLKVIGRSNFDLQPVFETLAENAVRLCQAERALIYRFDGQVLRFAASHNMSRELQAFIESTPTISPSRAGGASRAALERRTIHIHDVRADAEYTWGGGLVEPTGTVLAVPMLRADELLGVVVIYRHEVRPFTDSQIALVETFADQAAIAIESARLLTELQTKNASLTESLDQQTATAEILRVISSSPTDVQPVFDTIAEAALRLCG